jgi:hypothetical protein
VGEVVKIHLGVDSTFRAATKAHPGLLVSDLQVSSSAAARSASRPAKRHRSAAARARSCRPVGNRVELMERKERAAVGGARCDQTPGVDQRYEFSAVEPALLVASLVTIVGSTCSKRGTSTWYTNRLRALPSASSLDAPGVGTTAVCAVVGANTVATNDSWKEGCAADVAALTVSVEIASNE